MVDYTVSALIDYLKKTYLIPNGVNTFVTKEQCEVTRQAQVLLRDRAVVSKSLEERVADLERELHDLKRIRTASEEIK